MVDKIRDTFIIPMNLLQTAGAKIVKNVVYFVAKYVQDAVVDYALCVLVHEYDLENNFDHWISYLIYFLSYSIFSMKKLNSAVIFFNYQPSLKMLLIHRSSLKNLKFNTIFGF